jgi:hypothetical protein
MTTVIPVQSPGLATARQVPRAPLLTIGATFCCVTSCTTSEGATLPSSLLRAHAPDKDPLTGFGCPYSDESLSAVADHQSLRGIGLSRHYLCNPCVGAWTFTPQCPSGALARFFPEDNGLTSDVTGSAHQTPPTMQLQQGILFRGCSHFVIFRLPSASGVLDPQIAPTAVVLPQGGRVVYTTHSSFGYLPRDLVSLRIRHESACGGIRLDFHQLDCSLAGRSDVHKYINIFLYYNKLN